MHLLSSLHWRAPRDHRTHNDGESTRGVPVAVVQSSTLRVGLIEEVGDLDELNSILRDAASGQDAAVLALADRVGDRAVLNFARNALQVYLGCREGRQAGHMTAHIPLSRAQFALLEGRGVPSWGALALSADEDEVQPGRSEAASAGQAAGALAVGG